jgi:hypothetical protein
MKTASTERLMLELRRHLREVFALHGKGSGAELMRAQGYVDGYMRVLLEAGLVNAGELLRLVAAERAAERGPATREIAFSEEHCLST